MIRDAYAGYFNPPLPNASGLPLTNETYSYVNKFPSALKPELFGRLRRLELTPEWEGETPSSPRPQSVQEAAVAAMNEAAIRESEISKAKTRYAQFYRVMSILKAIWKMRKCRSLFLKKYVAIRKMQLLWRSYCFRRCQKSTRANLVMKVVILQKLFRCRRYRLVYMKKRISILLIQSFCRMLKSRLRYKMILRSLWKIQKVWRGTKIRKLYRKMRKCLNTIGGIVCGRVERRRMRDRLSVLFEKIRQQMFILWCAEHTPLLYRSRFWLYFEVRNFFHLSLHRIELQRLWLSLGYFNRLHNCKTFLSQLNLINSIITSNVQRRRSDGVLSFLAIREAQLKEEKDQIYRLLQRANKTKKDPIFRLFGIQADKLRKRTVRHKIWTVAAEAQSSAKALLSLQSPHLVWDLNADRAQHEDWIEGRKMEAIYLAAVEMTRACFTAIVLFSPQETVRSQNTAKSPRRGRILANRAYSEYDVVIANSLESHCTVKSERFSL